MAAGRWTVIAAVSLVAGCGAGGAAEPDAAVVDVDNPYDDPVDGPPAGNPDGDCAVPELGGAEDISAPTTVVGDGSPESCTGEAFIAAVAEGGVITFDCGPDEVVIELDRPARVYNDASDEVVIDGGGLVTLSGGGRTRILYMNTCDEELVWTTPHCDNQDHPRLTVQNITFADGNAEDEGEDQLGGGGAIFARGGQFKAVNARFFGNRCAAVGQDVGGGAIRVFDQYEDRPVYLVNTTFGGEDGLGNTCSNGGAISSIGVSWTILNSLFRHNTATGEGANPRRDGTPGGGSGGAIYNDGNTMTLSLCGTAIEENEVNEHGAAIFFVTNDRSGDLHIARSVIRNNRGGSWYVLPGISMHEDTEYTVDDASIVE
jgi:hypothetical protein